MKGFLESGPIFSEAIGIAPGVVEVRTKDSHFTLQPTSSTAKLNELVLRSIASERAASTRSSSVSRWAACNHSALTTNRLRRCYKRAHQAMSKRIVKRQREGTTGQQPSPRHRG